MRCALFAMTNGRAYASKRLRFTPPAGWIDRSVVAFAFPMTEGDAPTVVVTRDVLLAGEDLVRFCDRQLVTFARLQGFELHGRWGLPVADRPAIDVRFAWQVGGSPMVHRMVFLLEGADVVLCVGGTARGEAVACVHGAMDGVFESMAFVREA